jgi:hypothetical protein
MLAFSRAIGLVLAAAGVALPAVAQGPGNPMPFDTTGVADTSMFAPITLPAPNAYRLGSGAPRAKVLAEPRRLRPRGDARHGQDHVAGQAPTPVHEQLA